MRNFCVPNDLILDKHKRLVNLIMEEADLFEKAKLKEERERHELILGFLVDLQCLTSKELKNESN